jgi:hypothetical protein
MAPRSLPGLLVLLAACGGVQYTTLTATPSAAPPDVADCARNTLNKLHYSLLSYDATDYRIVARRINDSTSRANPEFRRIINRMEIDALPGSNGKTTLKVVGHTSAEYITQRGPTETEEPASPAMRQDAQALVQACGEP